MVADHGHGKVGAVLAAIFFRQGKPQMTRLVGTAPHLGQQFFPLVARQTLIIPVGAGMFAPVVEEALIIVLRLKRLDFLLDEVIQHGEIVGDLLGNPEIHELPPSLPPSLIAGGGVLDVDARHYRPRSSYEKGKACRRREYGAGTLGKAKQKSCVKVLSA